jgi:hypothetical protein
VSQTPEIVYSYVDESGEELFQCVRFPAKRLRQRHHDGTKWVWNLEGVPRVLYRLPEVLAAGSDHRAVWCPEGEKDAEALTALGFVATTSSMGASSWQDEYADAFRGCAWVLIPCDADAPGRALAEQKAQSCHKRGIPAKVIDPYPALNDGADVADLIAELGEQARETLERLAKQAPTWAPKPPATPLLPIVSFREFAMNVGEYDKTRDYLGGLIRGGTRTHVIGPIGHGKTTFMAEMVSAAVHGTDFLGFTGSGAATRALYIELGDMAPEEVQETFYSARFNLNDDRFDLVLLPDGLEVDRNEKHRAMIEDALARYNIVVIDPWYKLLYEELSDGMKNVRTVTTFLDRLRDRSPRAAVVVGFHANEPQPGQRMHGLGSASGYKAFQRGANTAVLFERLPRSTNRSRVTWAKTRSKRLPKMGTEWLVEWHEGIGFQHIERKPAWQEALEYVTDEWQSTHDIAEAWAKGIDWTRRALKEAAFNGAAESRGGARGYGGAAMWRLSNADQEALDVTA